VEPKANYCLQIGYNSSLLADNLQGVTLSSTTQAPPPSPEDIRAQIRAQIRDDLIRRLFAVAISVGAATTLAKMEWVQLGRWPCLPEWQQLWIIIAAMTATVLSWDGYLFSIKDRPLRNFGRFAIDILLVFIYMFLLMTSQLLVWWLFLHALIFTLYAMWDLLTIYDWPAKYDSRLPEEARPTVATIGSVYIGGLRDSKDVSRGPIITIVWGIYFWGLYFLNLDGGLRNRIFGMGLFVIAGLYLYRQDKDKRYTIWKRLAWVAVLFVAGLAYVRWGLTDARLWTWAGPHIGSASCG
jgi:hypothetical protein